MRSKLAFLVIMIILLSLSVKGQDAIYSQFYANPLYLNPALAGSKICPRLTLNYRNQWPGLGKGYVSYSAAWDQQVDKISGGVGFIANADVAGGGTLNTYSGNAIYSYRLQATRKIVLNLALEAGYLQYSLNWDKLVFEDQIVPGTGEIIPTTEQMPPNLSIGTIDFSTGFLAGYDQKIYIGAAMHHITMPDMAFYTDNLNRLDIRFTVHAGALFDLEEGFQGNNIENLSVSPNIVYIQQGDFRQINGGMYVNLYPFVAGAWYRHTIDNPDAAILLIGFQQEKFKVGYSFDFTVSRLSMKSGGAHEISFAWQFPCPTKEFRYKAIKCPRF
ncbi:MAG TPA: type IX secretion system membrane protein PorP/SprF [Bacteroidales bacterium]|nr:type IX secretion system membrane protein PorP/SprF [Bacteroidales bacterium]